MAFIAYPLVGVAWTLGEAAVVAVAGAIATSGIVAGAVATGHHKDHPSHADPNSGIAEDDEDHDGDYPGGKDLPPGDVPAHPHTSHQEGYIGSENEVTNNYWHYVNLLCRKFYNRHRRLAWAQPEKYAMALFYFLRRNRRIPRRMINRSALIETPGDHLYHKEMARLKRLMNTPVARRARGRAFLAS